MGSTTSKKGFRYPNGNDGTTIAQYFQNLATDIDNAWATDWTVTVDSGPSGMVGVTSSSFADVAGFVQSSGVAVPTNRKLEVEFSCPIASITSGFVFLQLVIGTTPSVAKGSSNGWWSPTLRYEIAGTGAVMPYRLQGYIAGSGAAADIRGTGGTMRLRHRII